MPGYVLDSGWEKERDRLAGLEYLYDSSTIRIMTALGVRHGSTCLEVGGGGGSVTEWLCRRVGKLGTVVASDIDTRFLDALDQDNLDVWRHDIVVDDLPAGRFDLAHARLVLEHLPDREKVLERLTNAVKPGGWVFIEDLDWRSLFSNPPVVMIGPEEDIARSVRIWREVVEFMAISGYDREFGARLPEVMIELGLEHVCAEARNPLCRGRSPGAVVPQFTIQQLQARLIDRGRVTEDDLDWAIGRYDDPGCWGAMSSMVSAWGRRPGSPEPVLPVPMPHIEEGPTERLMQFPIFSECTPEELGRVISMAEQIHVARGEEIVRKGERGEFFYVVLSGRATVRARRRRLAVLGPGAFFGETALLTGGPRTATVTADTAMVLMALDRVAFDELLRDLRSVAREVLGGVAKRTTPRTAWLWP
jgi:SAM-dependent methyltransferase